MFLRLLQESHRIPENVERPAEMPAFLRYERDTPSLRHRFFAPWLLRFECLFR